MRKEEEVIRRMEISVCSFECIIHSYIFRCYLMEIILDSSMVEHSAVNRGVVGSSPTRGVFLYYIVHFWLLGQAVKTSPFHGGNTGSIPVGVI